MRVATLGGLWSPPNGWQRFELEIALGRISVYGNLTFKATSTLSSDVSL